LGYVQYLGDLPEGNMGILPFWAFYETDLPWTWTDKKLPLADSDSFKESFGSVSPSGKKTLGST
jgi:hypothetical protein